MQLTIPSLVSQYRRDLEFRSSINTFGFALSTALIAAWLPLQLVLGVVVIEFIATYVIGNKHSFRPIITLQSTFLGWVAGLSLSFIILYSASSLSVFCLYTFVMALFHLSEFLFTAITNRRTLAPDSFLLNHSREYWIAAAMSWAEFAVEAYLVPSMKVSWLSLLGFFICMAGEFIRKTAMVHAGVGFTHKLALSKRPDHRLITSGIYGYLRHPGYTGWFMWSVGTQIVLCNPLCCVAYAVLSWKFFDERIHEEERDLIQFFGDEYLEYQKKVWIGIPFVRGCDL